MLQEDGSFVDLSRDDHFDIQHVFHFNCLANWFKDNMRCPVCNLKICTNMLTRVLDDADLPLLSRIIVKEYKKLRERCCLDDVKKPNDDSYI